MAVYLIYKVQYENRVYIGQTGNFSRRKVRHRQAAFDEKSRVYDTYFSRSIRKHGYENFEWDIMEVIDENSLITLDEAEKEWIAFYKLFPNYRLMNMTDGGEGLINPVKEIKEKIRQKALGRKHTLATRHKLSNINKGKKQSAETVEKRCSKTRGAKRTKEQRQNISNALMGVKRSSEFKKKCSERMKGCPSPMKGRKHSEESKKKMSESRKGQTFSEEYKKKMSIVMKRRGKSYEMTDEIRKKISASLIRRNQNEQSTKN